MSKKIKNLSFAVSDASIVKARNDSQFATLKINAFASGLNRNNIYVGEEALQKTAWTIIGKPLLWTYNEDMDDVGSHDSSVPCGFVPEQNNLVFSRTDDGRSMLQVSAKIWNYYSGALIDFFKRDDSTKPVSVELEVIDYQDKEGTLELLDFAYTGIAILGSKVMPAIPGAKALVVNFSEATDKYNKAVEYEFKDAKGKYDNERGDIIVKMKNKPEDIILNNVEDVVLEDVVEETEEVVETQEPEEVQEPEGGEEILENDAVGEEEEIEEPTAQEEPSDEGDEPQVLEEESVFQLLKDYFKDTEVEFDSFEELDSESQVKKLFELIKEKDIVIGEIQDKIQEFDSKLEELKSFKFSVDEAEFKRQVDETIATVSGALSEDEITILLESSKEYSLENVDSWKNVALATAYRATIDTKPQTSDISAPLPQREVKKSSGSLLW